jgi:hypothetical protein
MVQSEGFAHLAVSVLSSHTMMVLLIFVVGCLFALALAGGLLQLFFEVFLRSRQLQTGSQ